MKKILINYANEKYEAVRKINSWTGEHIAGFDSVIEYSPKDIDFDFRKEHSEILNFKRGNGLWLWKPYIIFKTLKLMEDGDVLCYCDSGAFFVRKIDCVLSCMDDDIFVNELPLIEKQWTTKFVIENISKDKDYVSESNQILATYMLIKKSTKSIEFVKKWLNLCCRKELINPTDNNQGECIAHREDQSLLSVLCKNEGIRPHKDISQFGRFPDEYIKSGYLNNIKKYSDTYKPVIASHRLQKFYFNTFLKRWLECVLPFKLATKAHTYKRRKYRS